MTVLWSVKDGVLPKIPLSPVYTVVFISADMKRFASEEMQSFLLKIDGAIVSGLI